jgi:hypothetical protein
MTKDDFKKLWKLNPEGDYDKTSTIVNIHINSNGMGQGNVNGAPVSFEIIYKAYKAYVEGWMRKFGKRDPKYVSNKDKLLSISDFMLEQMYRHSFEVIKTSRDIYLFKDFSDEEIEKLSRTRV